MKTTYRIEITYASDDLKREIEPHIDKQILDIKYALQAINKDNNLIINKESI